MHSLVCKKLLVKLLLGFDVCWTSPTDDAFYTPSSNILLYKGIEEPKTFFRYTKYQLVVGFCGCKVRYEQVGE